MNNYQVEWKKEALKSLDKLDPQIARQIKWDVEHELAKNPQKEGKPLRKNLKGLWKYRWNGYRVVYEIWESKLLISVLEVDSRANIYRKLARKYSV